MNQQPLAEYPEYDDPQADKTQDIRPVPRISIQAFCEQPSTAEVVEQSAKDRRMQRAHVKVLMGGAPAAAEFFETAPTPNVVIVEATGSADQLLSDLDKLANVCDAGTKVIVIGALNDVQVFRELLKRGVSEYLVPPLSPLRMIESVSELYNDPETEPLGKSLVFVGAKGGAGSSTVAHNVAWALSGQFERDVVLADFDMAFGTAGLDYDQDPPQGIAEAIAAPDRLDDTLLDRLLSKCSDRLSLLTAPANLDKEYDFGSDQFELLIETVQQSVPTMVIDAPHVWSGWMTKTLIEADEIVITSELDLASMRNTKNMLDYLKQRRENDRPPMLVVNKMGVPKRPEISVKDFAAAVEVEPVVCVPFDPNLFGTAANNGQMISELNGKSPIAAQFDQIAQHLMGQDEPKKQKKSPLAPIMDRLKLKSKS